MQQLSDAVQTAGRLAGLADELIEHFVDEARRAGASWTEIGRYRSERAGRAQALVPADSDDLDVLAAVG